MPGSVLLGDIGGTHSRFALSEGGSDPLEVQALDNDRLSSLEAGIAQYLAAVGVHPTEAVLAIAAPVKGPDIALTNRGWRFNLDDMRMRLGFARMRAVNDFEAQAWALTRLGTRDLRPIGNTTDASPGPRVVLGPGTGLGVAALMTSAQGLTVIATEAGHGSFGPANPDEDAIFARLRQHGPVSAETVLSGPGLERLHAALHPHTAPISAKTIDEAAHSGDAEALTTTQMFVRLLGRFAGDMMLVFRATGGVYITGGVAQAFSELIDARVFRAAFESHPPYRGMLEKTPTNLVTCSQSGLLGCAALAHQG